MNRVLAQRSLATRHAARSASLASGGWKGSVAGYSSSGALAAASSTLLRSAFAPLSSRQDGGTPLLLPTQRQRQHRLLSSYSLEGVSRGGTGGSLDWPVSKRNTVFNIVPQGHMVIVERLGKLHAIQEPGWFIAVPFIDNIAYVIDVRERALDIRPQMAITRDNVSVEVSGNLFVQFVDAQRAAYGAFNPLRSVVQNAQSAMRSAIGEMELDEILHGRTRLNTIIKGSLQEAAAPWGMEIRRYEITEITPDHQIRIAMDKQAAAERARREQVLRAEGDKRRAELSSEGVKISLTNESEGTLIKIKNEAEATKRRILLEAEGQAEAIRVTAKAQANALQMIAAELNKPGGSDAARLALARDYVAMYGEMGQKSNTIMFNDKPADVNALLSQAVIAMQASSSAQAKPQDIVPSIDATPPSEDVASDDGENSDDESSPKEQ